MRIKISFKFELWLYLSYGIYNLLLSFNDRYKSKSHGILFPYEYCITPFSFSHDRAVNFLTFSSI